MQIQVDVAVIKSSVVRKIKKEIKEKKVYNSLLIA